MQSKNLKQVFSSFVTSCLSEEELDIEIPMHRYYGGVKHALRLEKKEDIQDFILLVSDLYSKTSIYFLPLNELIRLYHRWKKNPYILELLIQIGENTKSSCSTSRCFWEFILKYCCFTPIENATFYGRFYLIVTLLNKYKIDESTWVEWQPLFTEIILKDGIKFSEPQNPKSIDNQIRKSHWCLFEWFNNFQKLQVDTSLYKKVYVRYFIQTHFRKEFNTKYKHFVKLLNSKLPADYMINLYNVDFYKLYSIYQIHPQLVEKLSNKITHSSGFTLFLSLFENYTFSGAMLECFYANENERLAMNIQEKQWFVATLQGESIRKQVNLPCTLTKRAAHIFIQLPCNTGLTVKQAIIYSALLANEVRNDFAKLITQRIYLYDHIDYWITTLSILFHKGLDTLPLYEVIDYISDQVFRKKRNIDFKTKKLLNLYDDMEAWHYQLLLKRNYYKKEVFTFKTTPIQEFQIKKEDKVFKIVQVKNTKALYLEGQLLHHCVVTYNELCAKGICVIFSLRCGINNKQTYPRVTIEVRDQKIVQKRGVRNRRCTPQEDEIIQIWANENRLRIA